MDVAGEQLLQQDPMVLTPGEGSWYGPLGETGWDDLYGADENHAVVVEALLSSSCQVRLYPLPAPSYFFMLTR